MITAQYSAKLENLNQRIERTERWTHALSIVEARYPWIRLATLAAGVVGIFLASQLRLLLLNWIVAVSFLFLFLFIAKQHSRLLEKMDRLRGFQSLLRKRIARLTHDWEAVPAAGNIHVPADHPFARDLNITGERSIHQIIDTSTSRGGSQRLADWLLQTIPNTANTIERHSLVKELISKASFRTCLELDSLLSNPGTAHTWDTGVIEHWLESVSKSPGIKPLLAALGTLSLANLILFSLHALGITAPLWIGTVVIYLALQAYNFRTTGEVFDEAYSLGSQLSKLRKVLINLETYPYPPGNPLSDLLSPFTKQEPRPSTALRQISMIISAASLRNNPLLALLLNLVVPWDVFFAFELEKVKHSLRSQVPKWLNSWYEIEALVSIAGYADLHPHLTFPEIKTPSNQPILEFLEVGHPLIPCQDRVANDFPLGSMGEFVLITGSNMSGKSTFLRTVGINVILALAGCPVTARKMSTVPFRLFTSMTINDSLSDGISFFYAEVRRLKLLLDALDLNHHLPLLFLIDEIFRGTNNRERQIGSFAYTQSLTGKFGTGFLSTHDLELTNLAKENPFISNFHFKEQIINGQMVFDYKIHPGASPTTNALQIMKLAGLPIELGK